MLPGATGYRCHQLNPGAHTRFRFPKTEACLGGSSPREGGGSMVLYARYHPKHRCGWLHSGEVEAGASDTTHKHLFPQAGPMESEESRRRAARERQR